MGAEHIAADVSDAEFVATTCDSILSKYGAVDVSVNNAGITRDNVLLRMSDGDCAM
jgi:3-oxoacyl-[acyl-carrier protein] reductase